MTDWKHKACQDVIKGNGFARVEALALCPTDCLNVNEWLTTKYYECFKLMAPQGKGNTLRQSSDHWLKALNLHRKKLRREKYLDKKDPEGLRNMKPIVKNDYDSIA